ncbi:MAG: hypothetical protein ACI38Q_02095 [Candidatus Bruticola sp.]
MINKLVGIYLKNTNLLLRREIKLVLGRNYICSWETALPLIWLFCILGGMLANLIGYNFSFNWNLCFCWLTAVVTSVHFFKLAPSLAASVKKDRDMGILQTLSITPGGSFKSQLFKIIVYIAPYLLGWLIIAISTAVFCIFSPCIDFEIAGLGLSLSFFSIFSAASWGFFWGIFCKLSFSHCASSLRWLTIFLLGASYISVLLMKISQLESFFIIISLALVFWHKSVHFFLRGLPLVAALLCIAISYTPAVGYGTLPILDMSNPVRLSLGPLYSLDSRAMTDKNQASRWAYPILRSQFHDQASTSLNGLLRTYASSSDLVKRQVNNRIREEAEVCLLGGFLSCVFNALFCGVAAFFSLFYCSGYESGN